MEDFVLSLSTIIGTLLSCFAIIFIKDPGRPYLPYFLLFFASLFLYHLNGVTNSFFELPTQLRVLFYLASLSFLTCASLLRNQQKNFNRSIISLGIALYLIYLFFEIGERITWYYSSFIYAILILSFWFKKNEKNPGDFLLTINLIASFLLTNFVMFTEVAQYLNTTTLKILSLVNAMVLAGGLMASLLIEYNSSLYRKARYDHLTRLPNQNYLLKYEASLASEKISYWLVIIYIKGIRDINEIFGYQNGDAALIEACKNMDKLIGLKDFLARNNGNEFVLISTKSKKHIAQLVQSFRTKLNSIKIINGHRVNIDISAGAFYNAEAIESYSSAFSKASAALIQQNSRAQCLNFFSEQILATSRQKLYLQEQLRQAILSQSIETYYQPKFSSSAPYKVIGAEALARWKCGETVIPPHQFISLAEECNLISDIDKLMMQRAWLTAKELQEMGVEIRISVNFSPVNMDNQYSITQIIKEMINEYDLNSSYMEVEITESHMAQDGNIISELNNLRDLGVKTSIDDFGTGYSNLSQIKNLPIDIIKIDKCFVDIITHDSSIIEFIITLAKKLELSIVAEGVENRAQLDWLHANGCDAIQGHIFSKPLNKKTFINFVQSYTQVHDAGFQSLSLSH